MKTLEVYQKFFTDIWQLLQKMADPIGIGCLVFLLVGVMILISYGFSTILELYITTKQRFDMLVYSVFAFVFLGLLDLLIVYCYSHGFLASHYLFYACILLYFMAFYLLNVCLNRKVDTLMKFRNAEYLNYLETLKNGDEVTVLYIENRKHSFFKDYYLTRARIIGKEALVFTLKSDSHCYTFDPCLDYGTEDEKYFIFPDTSYNLFLLEIYKSKTRVEKWDI